MTRLHRAVGFAAAFAVAAGIAWASTARLATHADGTGLLRLSWSARAERIETCRPHSEEELARLPAHMRQAVVCEGESAAYRLNVRRNGAVITDRVVHGGGWRRDRPLYVFDEIPQPAGDASISVRFERIGPGSTTVGAASTRNLLRRDDAHVPASLVLEERIHFKAGSVVLVTYDGDRRTLVTVP